MYDQTSLAGVALAGGKAFALLRESAGGGVEPRDSTVDGREKPFGNRRIGLKTIMVEPARGEAHDGPVHAVLDSEHADARGLFFGNTLHEGGGEAVVGSPRRLYSRRELLVVATKDYLRATQDSVPAGRFKSLSRLVDEEGCKTTS